MSREPLGRITFVALDGRPPPDLVFEAIPDPAGVAEAVRSAFGPFLAVSGDFTCTDDRAVVLSPEAGLHLVYVYGHAWLEDGSARSSRMRDGHTVVASASALLDELVPESDAHRTILILDCCHAAAFDEVASRRGPRMTIYASGRDEKAIALTGERATRLSLAFARTLNRKTSADLAWAAAEVAKRLYGDGVIVGQTVSYRLAGLAVTLSQARSPAKLQREKTVALIRNLMIGGGAAAASGLVYLAWFLWSHVMLDIDVSSLRSLARDIRIVVSEENPGENASTEIINQAVPGNRTRVWAPAANLILRIEAGYGDGADRSLAFHLDLDPSFSPEAKILTLSPPPTDDIRSRPGMAYVPQVAWMRGRDRTPDVNARPFWIDIRPPTVSDYRPAAEDAVRAGLLEKENSFVLAWGAGATPADERSPAGRVGRAQKDEEAPEQVRSAFISDIVVGPGDLPCPQCPAPMTRLEAEQYCHSRGLRLPTASEWELAVRGVDGRLYPWGDRPDVMRANIPGLPDVGQPAPALKPVDSYPDQRSPFGLIDTVGNAGDWVEDAAGALDRTYLGSTFQFNPEEATVFMLAPVTDFDYLSHPITARCVSA